MKKKKYLKFTNMCFYFVVPALEVLFKKYEVSRYRVKLKIKTDVTNKRKLRFLIKRFQFF